MKKYCKKCGRKLELTSDNFTQAICTFCERNTKCITKTSCNSKHSTWFKDKDGTVIHVDGIGPLTRGDIKGIKNFIKDIKNGKQK